MRNVDIFETPVKSKKVRQGIWAHAYRNGTINIMGEKYIMYSMTEAIRKWVSKNPARTTKHKYEHIV